MAKPLQIVERVLARFEAGTLDRIRAVTTTKEGGVSGFIRAAVLLELRRRERRMSEQDGKGREG